jgi:hypothetical protein
VTFSGSTSRSMAGTERRLAQSAGRHIVRG